MNTKLKEWLKTTAYIGVTAYFGIALLGSCTPRDATDGENGERSGMQLYTDHGTGCQYVGSVSLVGVSGITPRLDANGKQVCQ